MNDDVIVYGLILMGLKYQNSKIYYKFSSEHMVFKYSKKGAQNLTHAK